MRTVSFAIVILAVMGCGLLHAEDTIGFSLIEIDEEAGMVYSLSYTEAGYESSFYYLDPAHSGLPRGCQTLC